MIAEPGFLRIRGTGKPHLAPMDVKVEAQMEDGRWLPLRGVCSVDIRLRRDELTTAVILFELGALDLEELVPNSVQWVAPRSAWQRFVAWLRAHLP